MKIARLLLVFTLLAQVAWAQRALPGSVYSATKTAESQRGMVVAPHPLASAAGVEILKQGGNAIDAAVAVQWVMAVVYPRAGNVGGGGFMVIRLKDGATAAIDYREKAPLAAHRDMYLDSLGQVMPRLSQDGHLAAGVPGTPAGLLEVHRKYGRLPMAQLMARAIEYADKGFSISEGEAARLNSFQEAYRKQNTAPTVFIKDQWKAGDRLVQKDLAAVLKRIRKQGAAGFYEGKTADLIAQEMQRGGGIITREDLKNYRAQWRTPVSGQYKGYRVISMPPSSSGGVALLQMLEMVEPYPLGQYGFQSAEAVHLMAEAERRAYADRAEYLGDTDFYKVPMDSLLNETYLRGRMADFNPAKAGQSAALGAGKFQLTKESFETEHTSIVDAEGNAVSVTTTLNSNYGGKVVVGGGGFFLNNEMDDFSVKPGVPNQFGLVGNEANAIQPGKRMLSSMTPTIVEKDGQLFMVLGAPGGSTIITAVFQVLLNVVEFNLDLESAVNAGRFHHQWLPDQIMVEEAALSPQVRQALTDKGHKLQSVKYMAVIKAIQRLPDGRLIGAGDPRNPDDDAEGE
ncbi:MAG TPA: gamma-glutamyltransferase [Saprospiraceae bacterium]|nr:gamma-glutamyltransferase [Saprospiraceae bacterium]